MSAAKYYLWLDDKASGPYTIENLNRLWYVKRIDHKTLYATEGMEKWSPIGEILTDILKAKVDAPRTEGLTPTLDAALGINLGQVIERFFSLGAIAVIAIMAGCAIAAYFFAIFDPSVPADPARINNLGLLHQQQNGVICGVGLAVMGSILLVVERLNRLAAK